VVHNRSQRRHHLCLHASHTPPPPAHIPQDRRLYTRQF
jgi:hypothetical protein